MALTPVGKRLTMVAQNYLTPDDSQGMEGLTSEIAQEYTQDAPVDEPGASAVMQDPMGSHMENPVDEAMAEEAGKPMEESDKPSLTRAIFQFLSEHAGYPPRRLQEFKSQFYDETGSKGGATTVSITLPDLMYGRDEQIPSQALKGLIEQIEGKFGLSYVDYKRSNLQVVLNFSSSDPTAEQFQDQDSGDILDQVYGAPAKSSKEAATIEELIKMSKNNVIAKLRGEA